MPCNPFASADPDFTSLYIFGAGGHGREVAWLAEQRWGKRIHRVFIVDERFVQSAPIDGIDVRGVESIAADTDARYVVALGDCAARRRATAKCAARGLHATTIVHPRAEMSDRVYLGVGTVICARCVLTTHVTLEEHVHVNLSCTIGHDVHVGAFSTLSPGVHVCGHVDIGEGVFIGTGAIIINGTPGAPLTIGDGAVIAAGACVTGSVGPGALMAGVPAVRKR